MNQPDARRVAWDVLVAVEQGAFADAELGRRLTLCGLDARERALATRIVYGALAWQGYLDHLIATFARPPDQLDAPIRTLLRLAFFQLTKLSRVPDFAAVNTTVELSKQFRRGAASGLVNAVLRRFLREPERVAWPPSDSRSPNDLALLLSHPGWLVELWQRELGVSETLALLHADNEPAPTVLRVNRLRTDRDMLLRLLQDAGLSARPTDFAPDGIVLEHGCDPAALPGFSDGLFSAQGEASQLVSLLVGVRPGEFVWDACAAPGGKTTYLAEQLRNEGKVRATDVDARGLQYLLGSAQRLGLTCVEAVNRDAAADDGPPVDAVLVDAPCSGLGTLRQHPEIRWRRTAADLSQLAARQARLLRAVARRARPGGVLVYATCTIARIENEEVIAGFLREHPDFTITDPAPWLPAAARAFVDSGGFFRTFPHRGGLDGFFGVRLNRRQ